MAKKIPPKIKVKYFTTKVEEEVCNDWYDVADWLKERETQGNFTLWLSWEYLRG